MSDYPFFSLENKVIFRYSFDLLEGEIQPREKWDVVGELDNDTLLVKKMGSRSWFMYFFPNW